MTGPIDELLGLAGPHPVFTPSEPVRFSVIVRTQGTRPTSLREALESLEDQTHPAHQILVMTHTDDDDVVVEVRALGTDVGASVEIRQVSSGLRTAPLNAGLEAASGDYVCFLDDDDLARRDWLSAFAVAIQAHPGQIARARTGVQQWSTEGTGEPRHPIGPVVEPFATSFDLLAHVSHNETPICSIAVPLGALRHYGIRFADDLPVLEDWDFLMRIAPLTGVVSIDAQTSLYRQLDDGNAFAAETVETWQRAHARVVDRLAAQPLLLPAGDARRIASAHFVPGGGSRHESDLAQIATELDRLTKSPLRWGRRFGARVTGAARVRIGGLRR